ncbi:hypothetical protein FB45DRAFT_1103352 [Roridomyces roridus]|uniref:MYND-type domain-containing protein n=1 Tax=Roridomyces roridus TaxID=1738132 RepID=A0AAD7BE47_9AGAR|nr:hypothetical protein FB45DRAFT_1103352 [Roridomyces roridus]
MVERCASFTRVCETFSSSFVWMISLPLPLPGLALTEPEQWNNEWEAVLRRPMMTPEFCFSSMLNDNQQLGLDICLDAYPDLLSGTCAVQRTLTVEALQSFSNRDFENRWMRATPDARRKHLLAALAAVCSKARNLNGARAYCAPEIRLMRLRLSGTVFIDLLRSAMLDDVTYIPSTPRYVSHPKWDEFAALQGARNSDDLERVSLAEMMVLRTKFICYFLHFTLCSFHGLEYPVLMVTKEHKSIERAKDPQAAEHKKREREIFGTEAAKARRAFEIASTRERTAQRVGWCSYMGCAKHEPEDGSVKFTRCEQCFENMQRQVLYCSSKCQQADWKLRHREVCGKSLTFDAVATLPEHPANSNLAVHADLDGGPPWTGSDQQVVAHVYKSTNLASGGG